MGCLQSSPALNAQEAPEVKEDHTDRIDVIVNMVSAEGVPDCDTAIKSESRKADCYASFYLSEDADGKDHLTIAERTPYRLDSEGPCWNTCRRLSGLHNQAKRLYLVIQLLDYDELSADDEIGTAIADITEQKSGEAVTVGVKWANKKMENASRGKSCSVTFKIFHGVSWPKEKTIFFIRHGESRWNEAEHDILKHGNVLSGASKMAGGRDHPLNHIGIKQAMSLNRRWKLVKDGKAVPKEEMPKGRSGGAEPTKEEIEAFLNADVVYSSPLTRALQTCLIGLKDHPTITKKGVTLQRQLREVKNRIGWDALGKEVGEKIPLRARGMLEDEKTKRPDELKGLSPEEISKVMGVKIHLNDTLSVWWDPDRDTSNEIGERLGDLIHILRYSPETRIICVGHSLFFREVCRAFLGGGYSFPDIYTPKGKRVAKGSSRQSMDRILEDDELPDNMKLEEWEGFAKMLKGRKLGNGACLMARFDFSGKRMKDWKIAQAKLMFGSTFKLDKKKDKMDVEGKKSS